MRTILRDEPAVICRDNIIDCVLLRNPLTVLCVIIIIILKCFGAAAGTDVM